MVWSTRKHAELSLIPHKGERRDASVQTFPTTLSPPPGLSVPSHQPAGCLLSPSSQPSNPPGSPPSPAFTQHSTCVPKTSLCPLRLSVSRRRERQHSGPQGPMHLSYHGGLGTAPFLDPSRAATEPAWRAEVPVCAKSTASTGAANSSYRNPASGFPICQMGPSRMCLPGFARG